LNLSNKF